ncbi:MAG: molybdopterin-dependent oxidoreductase [Acidobacteriia bacterium]|nr:molybdopterin-dependent oxidoreductase [Terriglobia bacterium]
MIEVANVTRRGFLQGMLSAGAFVLTVQVFPETLIASASAAGENSFAAAAFHSGVYLAIETDGTVHIIAHRSEMGNGSKTSLPLVLADELDADWKRVKLQQADADEKYGSQDTDGSHSVRDFFEPMRQAGATARLMLVRAAAQRWNVPEKECHADLHRIVHTPSGKKLGYGELASAAAALPVPKKEELQYKPKTAWRYIGKGAKTYDLRNMVSGKALYGQDARIDGMLYAAIAHPPVLGGTVKSLDDKDALAFPGVKQTHTIDTFKAPHAFQALGGVAVLADSTWAAFQGRKKLKIEWALGAHGVFTSDAYKKQLQETARKPGKVFRNNGDVDAVFAKGGKIIEAEYYAPLLAHASMEPPAAAAEFADGKVTVWACTQNPQGVQEAIAGTLGIKKEDVTCHVTLQGGAFGRKSFPDFAVEAAVLSKKTGKPVKVVWSREDDIKFDSYHSVAAMYMKATLGPDGKPEAWLQRSVFPPINSTFIPGTVNSEPFEMSLGFTDVAFALANHRVENGAAEAHVRIGWLRSVANIYHAFAIHSFADELAHAAGKDPLEYVLSLLGPARIMDRKELPADYPNQEADYKDYPIDIGRMRHVLELAAEKAAWGKKHLPKGHGMGLAVHRSFLTYVATVVHVEVTKDGELIIHQVDTAVDAGQIVNPITVQQQFEGAAVFGTSLARTGEITATNGVIDQSNFNDYPVARINEAPRATHVHIVPSDAPPAGIGEPGVPPFAPALYNAIFAATGKRHRELPLTRVQLV